MSDRAALKDAIYDAFYDSTSAFAHANWAAVRDASLDLCVNSLHRLRRVPSADHTELPDVCADAATLASGIRRAPSPLGSGCPWLTDDGAAPAFGRFTRKLKPSSR
jgi:hypothetical protein